jgi:hypothetical protein
MSTRFALANPNPRFRSQSAHQRFCLSRELRAYEVHTCDAIDGAGLLTRVWSFNSTNVKYMTRQISPPLALPRHATQFQTDLEWNIPSENPEGKKKT